jgi:hypothetical protein
MQINWDANNFNYKNTRLYQSRNYLGNSYNYYQYHVPSHSNLFEDNSFYHIPTRLPLKRVKNHTLYYSNIEKRCIKSLFIREFYDESFINKPDLKIPYKSKISSICSLAENLKSTEIVNAQAQMESVYRLSESQNQLNDFLFQIDSELKNVSRLENILNFKCNISQNNEMILEYERFHKQNKRYLAKLIEEFKSTRQSSKFSILILKFLLDILTEEDMTKIESKECYLLNNFFINRFFRGLKTQILAKIEQTEIFKKFSSLWNLTPKNNNDRSKCSLSILEQMSYSFSINLWYSTTNTFDKNQIFDYQFVSLFMESSRDNFKNIFKEICVRIHRLIYFLIFKIIIIRFNKTQVVYDEIECVEEAVCQIVEKVIAIMIELKDSENQTDFERQKKICFKVFSKLNQKFVCGNKNDLMTMTKYIKFREMREYLGRKKKSKFVRPRRNDEKLKKIYKNLLKTMLENFKQNNIQNFSVKTKSTMNNSENSSIQSNSKEMKEFKSNMTWSSAQSPWSQTSNNYSLLKQNISPLLPAYLEKKLLPSSDQLKRKFYEFYFRSTSKQLNVPFEYFFDPLKKIYKNTGFKSFTIKYFRLLLQSDQFKTEVENLFENYHFLLDALLDYPKTFSKMLTSVPTILMDQQKKKSKFLWTSYEFFFASYFFKKKVSI